MCQACKALLRPMAGTKCAAKRSQRFLSVLRFVVAPVLFQGLLCGRWLFPIAFWHMHKSGIIALCYPFYLLSINCSPGHRPIFLGPNIWDRRPPLQQHRFAHGARCRGRAQAVYQRRGSGIVARRLPEDRPFHKALVGNQELEGFEDAPPLWRATMR